MDRQYKQLGKMTEFKAEETGEFRATFSTMNVIDLHGDVTLPGAFKQGQEVRISYWAHRWGDLPVGKGAIFADDTRAWVDGKFFLDTDGGVQTYRTVKNLGTLQEWSYGFQIEKQSYGTFAERDVRFLEKVDVFEVSPVLLGAGRNTGTDTIKAFEWEGEDGTWKFADHTCRMLVSVESFVERAKSLNSLRAKEGRVLSASNRQRLMDVAGQMGDLKNVLDELVAATAPKSADNQVTKDMLHSLQLQVLATDSKVREVLSGV